MIMRFLWPPLAILTCVSAGWLMYRDSMQEEPEKKKKDGPKSSMAVEVTKLSTRDLVESISLVGSLEAEADIQIYARGSGYLVKMPFDVQDAVKTGDTIAILDDSEQKEFVASSKAALQVTQAKLKAQQTKLDQALSNYRRQQELDKSGVSTEQQSEKAKADLEISQAELELQQAEVDQAIANLHSSEMNLKQMEVTSPINGFVAQRFLHVGDLVSSDKEIMRVVSIDSMKTIVNIVEKDYERVHVGQTAEITTDTFPDRLFTGTIVRKSPVVDPQNRMAEVHIEIPNEDHSLKPGMHARVRIKTDVIEKAAVLPVAALLQKKDHADLYVVSGEPLKTSKREVATGATDGEFVEILSGVKPDEKIIALGSHLVEDGDEVTIYSSPEPVEKNISQETPAPKTASASAAE